MRHAIRTALPIIFLLSLRPLNVARAQNQQLINDKDVHLVDFQDLTYPAVARAAHIQGLVVVRAKLDERGKVVDATAISGADTLIPDSLANAKKWRFRPNPGGAAIIVYNFRLTDQISKSGCSHFALQAPNFATITGCVPEINVSDESNR